MKKVCFSNSASNYSNWLEYLFFVEGIKDVPVCAGLGRCGRCKIQFIQGAPAPTTKEKDILTSSEVEQNIRLACEHKPLWGQEILPFWEKDTYLFSESNIAYEYLGVDIGTTTLKWGTTFKEGFSLLGQKINPQMAAGAEVLSRVRFALDPDKLKVLQKLIREDLKLIFKREAKQICITGNSVMIYFLLGKDVRGFSRYPFDLIYRGNSVEKIFNREVYIPPLLGPFVGADISSGLYYLLKKEQKYPFIFCDFGTNGEIALVEDNSIYCTSIALGPALEGVGLSFGGVFSKENVDKFELIQLIQGCLKSNKFRITGTGYLSLLSLLLNAKVIDRKGFFQRPKEWKMKLKLLLRNNKLFLTENVYLAAKDVEEILKVKAALNMGLNFLLSKSHRNLKDIKKVYISGALGDNLISDILINLGFFPFSWEDKLCFVSNTALKGAIELARQKNSQLINHLVANSNYLNLALDEKIIKDFVRYMCFEFVS